MFFAAGGGFGTLWVRGPVGVFEKRPHLFAESTLEETPQLNPLFDMFWSHFHTLGKLEGDPSNLTTQSNDRHDGLTDWFSHQDHQPSKSCLTGDLWCPSVPGLQRELLKNCVK